MFNEILLTVLVMLGAVFYVRYKGGQERRRELERQAPPTGGRHTAMLVAGALVLLTLTISGAMFYMQWQESHRLYTVLVINSHSGEVQTYHVYRDDIDGRRFRTTDGRLISLSSAERMEVVEGTMEHAEQ